MVRFVVEMGNFRNSGVEKTPKLEERTFSVVVVVVVVAVIVTPHLLHGTVF